MTVTEGIGVVQAKLLASGFFRVQKEGLCKPSSLHNNLAPCPPRAG